MGPSPLSWRMVALIGKIGFETLADIGFELRNGSRDTIRPAALLLGPPVGLHLQMPRREKFLDLIKGARTSRASAPTGRSATCSSQGRGLSLKQTRKDMPWLLAEL